MQKAYCLFRLGIAPLHAHIGRWTKPSPTHVLARTCQFCVAVYERQVVEDEYHVCMECPLYDVLRYALLSRLDSPGPNSVIRQCSTLTDLFRCLLNLTRKSQIWLVCRFLLDVLTVRCVYLEREPGWWCMDAKRRTSLTAHVQYHPTPMSFPYEHMRSHTFLHSLGYAQSLGSTTLRSVHPPDAVH